MVESRYRWRNRELREHVEVIDGKRSPSIVLYNATYLNGILNNGIKEIYGSTKTELFMSAKMPVYTDNNCEMFDCSNYLLVLVIWNRTPINSYIIPFFCPICIKIWNNGVCK